MERYGKELTGSVLELGGEKKYDHGRFAPNASSYSCTNIEREYDEYLDLTKMPFADNSQDAFICVSVLEHVFPIETAFAEIHRTLRVGGALLLTIPFAYPKHDVKDYWRVGESGYEEFLKDFEIKAFVHLGGMVSSLIELLRRPLGRFDRRYLAYKALALLILLFFGRSDRIDGFPLGYGVYAVKRS